MIRNIGELARRLIVHERVPVRDLAVLLADEAAIEKTGWKRGIAGYPATVCSNPADDDVIVDTVRRFKGLESKGVILVMTRDLVSSTELLYVATSRARTHLVIMKSDRDIERMNRPV